MSLEQTLIYPTEVPLCVVRSINYVNEWLIRFNPTHTYNSQHSPTKSTSRQIDRLAAVLRLFWEPPSPALPCLPSGVVK